MKEIDNNNARKYRNVNVRISGARLTPTDYIKVPEKMEKINKYEGWNNYHLLIKAALTHDYTDFVKLIVEEKMKILNQYLDLIG